MADLELLRSLGTEKQFAKNQTVFMQNESGSCMYVVLKGIFGVYIDTLTDFPIRVAEIEKGSFFGEMAVINGSPRSATIISEEEGSALIVEKDNFESLLEKAPDIAEGILSTLRYRMIATAQAVRDTGKDVPEIPSFLKSMQFNDVKSSMAFLAVLAQKVRKMNDLLIVRSVDECPPTEAETLPAPGIFKLLPEGYTPFNLEDKNNNTHLLRAMNGFCPYCCEPLTFSVPVFSGLEREKTTLDQRVKYKNFDILWYSNIVCPKCIYTDSYQEFAKPQAERDENCTVKSFKNEEGFTGFEAPDHHTLDEVIKSYYQRNVCLIQTNADPLRHATSWIRLYWLFGDYGSEPFAKQAAIRALDYYKKYKAQNSGNLTGEAKMRINAILGELTAVINDYEKAAGYFKENVDMENVGNNELKRQSAKRYEELWELRVES